MNKIIAGLLIINLMGIGALAYLSYEESKFLRTSDSLQTNATIELFNLSQSFDQRHEVAIEYLFDTCGGESI